METHDGAALRRVMWNAADTSVRVRLGAALVAAGLAALMAVAGPLVLKVLLDGLAAGDPVGQTRMVWLAVLYVGTLGAARLAEQVQAYAFATGEQRLQQRLNAVMFAHVLRLPMRFHLDAQAGGLVQALTLGLHGARIIMTHLVISILPVALQAALVVIVVAQIFDPTLWLTAVASLIAYVAVFSFGVWRLSAPTQAVSNAQVELGGLFADGIINVEPIKAFSAERQIDQRYGLLLHQSERHWRVFHARRFENGMVTALVFVLVMAAVVIQAMESYLSGRITIGDFVLLHAYILQLIRPLEVIGFALRDIAQGKAYLERWSSLLAHKGESEVTSGPVRDGEQAHPATINAAPDIRFESVSFAYGPDRQILNNVSFTVPAGRRVAIVGASGAGKSTLVRLLMRYYAPRSGRIVLDEAPIDVFDLEKLRARIAIVSQDTVLFNDTLENNILFARTGATKEELERAVARAHLDVLINRLPDGLATKVGERGLKLSGGEKQRVALARALLKEAPVLVLDEATSALDTATEAAILADLMSAAGGRTTLIVTHRLPLAAQADEILVLRDGGVVERGGHAELLAADGAYAALWRRQDLKTLEMGLADLS
jgi:ABC-type transport system involved in Fe-S cluster assembly fused permease/ATPase subunit